MSPPKVRVTIVMRKSSLVDEMLRGLATLPLTSLEAFHSDARDAAAAESYLRRAWDALPKLRRHILAKGLGERTLEYEQIALALRRADVSERCPRRGRRGVVPARCFRGEVHWRRCRTLDVTFRPMGSVRKPALENVYKPSGDVVAREIGGEIIVVPLVAGSGDMEDEPFILNDTGKAIWDQLDGRRSLAGVVAALTPEFEEAEDGAMERDVLGLVAELVERRMLVAV